MTSQLVEMAIKEIGAFCVSWAADGIRQSVKPPSPSPARESPPLGPTEHTSGCPVCAVHREAAEANALIAGLAEKSNAAGEVPAGLGGTIPLARKCLDDARAGLADVAISFPQHRSAIERTDRELVAARSSLDGTLTPASITAASLRTRDAWMAAYDLADAAFKPPAPPTQKHDPLIDWIDEVRTHPDMPTDEAISKLRRMLND